MVKFFGVIACVMLLVISCKKAEDRSCFKSYGEMSELEIPLDSVYEFRLYKNMTYHLYQDSSYKMIVRGGKNVIGHVTTDYTNYTLSVRNENKCHFLRDYDNKIEVEIHYPFYQNMFYSETSDSIIFHDTIVASQIHVELIMGGGVVMLNAHTTELVMNASHGVGSFKVSGTTKFADLRVQTDARGDATGLTAEKMDVYQNSTGDIKVNLESANAFVWMRGTGNVIYSGIPDSLEILDQGDGAVIPQ